MNYNFTTNEKDLIENSIGTLSRFCSLVSSYEELNNESTLTSFNLDETNFSTDEFATGILVAIEKTEDGFIADMIIDGIRRSLLISNIYDYDIIRVQRSLFNSDDTNWTYEQIDTYAYMLYKAYNVLVEDSVIYMLEPVKNQEELFLIVERCYEE